MKKGTWSFLINPFQAVLERSIINALKVAAYTDAALNMRKADTFYNGLYIDYHKAFKSFSDAVGAGKSQQGVQKGSTDVVTTLLDGLTAKVNAWDAGIQVSGGWAKGTSNYIACFPKGHTTFINGKALDRIYAINALSLAITDLLDGATPSTAFQAVIDDIDATYTALHDAYEDQKGEISGTGDDRDNILVTGKECMDALFVVYGNMVVKFPADPDAIKPLFDVESIMHSTQTKFTDTVKIGATDSVFKRKIMPNDLVRLTVHSPDAIDFGVVKEKNDLIGDKKVTVQGMESRIVKGSDIGDVPDSRYFKVHNPSNSAEGHFTIELIAQGKGVIN